MKPKLTIEQADKALAMIGSGAKNKDVIEWLDVSPTAFYGWLKNPKTPAQVKLVDGIKRVRVERKVWCLQKIHSAAENGSWQAAAWYLEREFPDEFARQMRVDARQEQKVTVKGVSDEEAMQDLAELAAKMVKSHE